MLSANAINEYKEIYKKEFNVDISDQEALAQGTKLLRIFNIIYKPISKEWIKKHEK